MEGDAFATDAVVIDWADSTRPCSTLGRHPQVHGLEALGSRRVACADRSSTSRLPSVGVWNRQRTTRPDRRGVAVSRRSRPRRRLPPPSRSSPSSDRAGQGSQGRLLNGASSITMQMVKEQPREGPLRGSSGISSCMSRLAQRARIMEITSTHLIDTAPAVWHGPAAAPTSASIRGINPVAGSSLDLPAPRPPPQFCGRAIDLTQRSSPGADVLRARST
jgi:hypothetical protein